MAAVIFNPRYLNQTISSALSLKKFVQRNGSVAVLPSGGSFTVKGGTKQVDVTGINKNSPVFAHKAKGVGPLNNQWKIGVRSTARSGSDSIKIEFTSSAGKVEAIPLKVSVLKTGIIRAATAQ